MPNENEVLEAALMGYEAQVAKLQEKIAELKTRISGGGGGFPGPFKKSAIRRKKRKLSAAGREAIAAAARKRWAALKATKE